jgi:hypothetical protein
MKFTESNRKIAEQIQEQLSLLDIQCVIVGSIHKEPPPQVVRSEILACDALLAIVRSERSDWVQNEIGMAYAAHKPIYALVEQGIPEVGGMLQKVTSHAWFREGDSLGIRKAITELASQLAGRTKEVCVVEPEEWLTSTIKAGTPFLVRQGLESGPTIRGANYEFRNRGPVTIAIKITRIPAGDLLMTIFIPPEFNLRSVIGNPDSQIERRIPQQICRITAGTRESARFSGFSYIKIVLAFPQAQAYVPDDWMNLRLLDVTSPIISGRYLFYGEGQVSIGSSTANTSPFESNPMVVKGEVSPAVLSGTVFTSKGKPLEYPGVVRAVGIAADPYHSTHGSTGRPVEGCYYLKLTDRGQYALAVAPGTYDIHARAIDYEEVKVATNLLIINSKTLDITLPYEPA